MVLAPRHPERNDSVAAEITRRRICAFSRLAMEAGSEEARRGMLSLDTIGELAATL